MMGSFNYERDEIIDKNEFIDRNEIKENTFRIKRFLNVFFVIIFVASFVMSPVITEAAVAKTTKVKLSKTSVSIYKGQKYQLKVTKANKKVKHKSIKWSTSNKKIVQVNQKGYIKGIKKGNAYVYCKVKWINNKTTTVKCRVKVYNPVKLKSYKLNKTSVSLKVGEKTTVKKVIKPSNATIVKTAIATSNKKVAIINSKGVITAKGVGTAKICIAIKTYDGKVYKRYVTVKVTKPAAKPTAKPIVEPTSIKFDRIASSRYVGGVVQLGITLLPANAANKKMTYVSSDTSVARINNVKDVSATGTTGSLEVVAVGVGKATITAKTSNGKVATYSIKVASPYAISIDKTELELKEETSGNVAATVTRYDGDAKAVEYSSSNTKVATVDKDGQVIAVSEGTAIITASIVSPTAGVPDTYNKATCKVTVTKADINLQHTKEPYISTYYFDPKPSCNKEIIIPIYVTDTDNREYLKDDDSKRFDVIVEVDGKKTYVRDMKPGDNKVSLGKMSKGNHYFALQVIDKDNGLKSHKLYNELMVVDPEEYAIKESEIYYMTTEDLTTYNIDNTNNEDVAVCIATKEGLNKLFEDTKEKGFRKIVLQKGIYRIDSELDRKKAISIPSYFTVDMNGATFKLATKTEDVGESIIVMKDTIDAHLTNGILEGNRFERKELGLETACLGEGITAVYFNGCAYSSLTNMTIKNNTGHTVGTQYVWGPSKKIASYTNVKIVDGEEIECKDTSTSNMIDISKHKAWSGYVSIGNGEGYRGTKGDSQILYVHFYDKDEKFLNTVEGHQYRKLKIPEDAVYARVTMYGQLTLDDNVSFHSKHLGEYLEISDIHFYDTRTTALAPSACNNILIENIKYTRAGNSVTPCAVDFEDGAQECQDVYYRNNEVVERSGTCTLIDNIGFNHVYENNKGHHMVIRRGVKGAVIRDTDDTNSTYQGSIKWTHGNKVIAKYNRLYNVNTGNIKVVLQEGDIEKGAEQFLVKDCTINASYIESEPKCVTYTNCLFKTFNGGNIRIEDSIVYPTSYLGGELYFKNCEFKNLETPGGEMTFSFNSLDAIRVFENCKFIGKTHFRNHNYFNTVTCNNCSFEDLYITVGVSSADNTPNIEFNNCDISSTADDFIKFGPYGYSQGRYKLTFNNSNLKLSSGNLINMYAQPLDDSSVTFDKCTIQKDGGKVLIGGNSSLTLEEVALKVNFNKCVLLKELDCDFAGVSKNVSIKVNN